MPFWPVNQCTPSLSKAPVLRFVYPVSSGSFQLLISSVFGSNRTIAF